MMVVRFSTSTHRDARPSIFRSGKCRVGIPVRDVLELHALEQASLDPSVREIRYQTGPRVDCPSVSLAGAVLRTQGGAFLLRVHETRSEVNAEDEAHLKFVLKRHGLQLLERSAQDIFREPMFSNVRKVWSYSGQSVSLSERLRLSMALEQGPHRIIELEARIGPGWDIVAAVCVLACENLVQLGLRDAPLGPQTVVKA